MYYVNFLALCEEMPYPNIHCIGFAHYMTQDQNWNELCLTFYGASHCTPLYISIVVMPSLFHVFVWTVGVVISQLW